MSPAQAVAPQVPLVDPNAEEALVGAMITSAEARAVGLTTCGAEDFNTAEHRAVFLAISSLMAAGLHVDPVTVHAQLRREPITLDTKVDWLEYLVNLQAKTSWSAKNAATYAELVAAKARARRARAASIELQQQLSEGVDPATAISTMFASLNESPSHQLVGMADLVDAAVDLLEQGRPKNGIGTRIPELDEILHGGFLPKNLVIIGARPGMGKSAFALSTAVNAAELGHKVLFVSGEMSRLEIAMRIVARYSGIPSSVSMNASGPESYTPGEIAKFTAALQKMAALPLRLVEGSTTISAIRARAQAEAMTGSPFELIVLDYLQIMKPEARQGNDRGRQNDVSDIARGAKDLAMELSTVVVALSQLSRKLEDRSDKRPMLSDLRDSGELEQAADTVVFLYRDEVYEPATQDAGVMELIVAKQRNGQSGVTARAAWNGELTTVLPLARGYGHATVVSKSGSTPGPRAPRGQAPEDSWGAEEEGAERGDAGEGVGQIF